MPGEHLNALEISANAVMAVSIGLAAMNNIQTWWTGIVGCLLFFGLFVRNQLYADATLQVFFIATSAIGWWHWHASNDRQKELPVTRARRGTIFRMACGAMVVMFAYGWLLHRFTNDYMPYVDAAVLGLSVVAQCLLMQRRLQSWAFWLAVNTLSVALLYSRGLLVSAVLYAAYWVNAWYGWWKWRGALSSAPA